MINYKKETTGFTNRSLICLAAWKREIMSFTKVTGGFGKERNPDWIPDWIPSSNCTFRNSSSSVMFSVLFANPRSSSHDSRANFPSESCFWKFTIKHKPFKNRHKSTHTRRTPKLPVAPPLSSASPLWWCHAVPALSPLKWISAAQAPPPDRTPPYVTHPDSMGNILIIH